MKWQIIRTEKYYVLTHQISKALKLKYYLKSERGGDERQAHSWWERAWYAFSSRRFGNMDQKPSTIYRLLPNISISRTPSQRNTEGWKFKNVHCMIVYHDEKCGTAQVFNSRLAR